MTEVSVTAALAAWNAAIVVINNAVADIRAGRNIAAAKQKAVQAIQDGLKNARIVGEATWFVPPADTQQQWERALVAYQSVAGSGSSSPTPTTEGIRIGPFIIPWSTFRNVLIVAGVAGFGLYLLGRQHGKRR